MGFGIRVKFTPSVRAKDSGAMDVVGGTLGFVVRGTPSSKAKRAEPKPARLIFHGAFLDHARGVSAPDFQEIATLEGKIVLDGVPPVPLFEFDPSSDFTYVEPAPEEGVPFRELRLDYDSDAFEAVPEDGDPLTRLRLPEEPEGTRFFELGIKLEIDGGTEADVVDNHRLDVPLGPLPGPLFEWPDELTASLPDGLTLILEEDGKQVALDWVQGQVLDGLRRFSFSRLRGVAPCTLTAKSSAGELVLLEDQLLNDPGSPIQWQHFLEELTLPSSDDAGSDVEFVAEMPVIFAAS